MPEPVDHRKAFSTMATRIEANQTSDFGGAMVIVGPDGRTIEVLYLDPLKDEAAFWAVCSAKIEAAKQEAMQNEQKMHQYGGVGMRR